MLENRPLRHHTARMLGSVIVLFVLAVIAVTWSATRGAGELARQHGLAACQRNRAQLLDQTVVLRRVSLQRDDQGRMRLLRQYSFDYSYDGIQRHRGMLALRGHDLQWITEPVLPA